ncbi:MAG: ATP-grasp domain-containing protein [Oscillospiraceae bacterium]
MKKAWLLYDTLDAQKNKHYIPLYFDAFRDKQVELEVIYTERLNFGIKNMQFFLEYDEKPINPPNFVISRVISLSLTQHLEYCGVKVYNNHTTAQICNDKQKTYEYICNAGIQIMDSYFIHKIVPTGSCKFNYPVVVKSTTGRGGTEVFLAANHESFTFAMNELKEKSVVVQKLASDVGKDLRVYVVGKTIIAAILRESTTDFRSNYGLGGKATVYILNEEEIALVNKIINLFDFAMVGVDFIFDQGKLIFNEIEDVVGSRMLYANTEINIVSHYVNWILHQ